MLGLAFLFFGLLLAGCTAPKYDASTFSGEQAIIDKVNLALTNQDCATAIWASTSSCCSRQGVMRPGFSTRIRTWYDQSTHRFAPP